MGARADSPAVLLSRITGPVISVATPTSPLSRLRTGSSRYGLDPDIVPRHTSGGNLLHLLQVRVGVHRRAAVGMDLEVEVVRATGVAGAAHVADDLTGLHMS